MRILLLILWLATNLAVVNAQDTSYNDVTKENQKTPARLQLSTSVIEQRYSLEGGSRVLRLLLNLTYTNSGNRSILLDKKSSLIYRKV